MYIIRILFLSPPPTRKLKQDHGNREHLPTRIIGTYKLRIMKPLIYEMIQAAWETGDTACSLITNQRESPVSLCMIIGAGSILSILVSRVLSCTTTVTQSGPHWELRIGSGVGRSQEIPRRNLDILRSAWKSRTTGFAGN